MPSRAINMERMLEKVLDLHPTMIQRVINLMLISWPMKSDINWEPTIHFLLEEMEVLQKFPLQGSNPEVALPLWDTPGLPNGMSKTILMIISHTGVFSKYKLIYKINLVALLLH